MPILLRGLPVVAHGPDRSKSRESCGITDLRQTIELNTTRKQKPKKSKRKLQDGFEIAHKKAKVLHKPDGGYQKSKAELFLSKPKSHIQMKTWMGKHHVQSETGYANDCLPLAWKNIIVSDDDFRKNIDSDILIDECNKIAMNTANSVKISQLCSNDGMFDISP